MNKMKKDMGFEKDILRLPGQSVNDELMDLIEEKVDFNLIGITITTVALITLWLGRLLPLKSSLVSVSIVLIISSGVFSYRLFGSVKGIHSLRQGRDGERYVGQLLNEMRVDGNICFNDVLGDNFNIDHVLIGSKGIYVIETKAWSKDSSGGSISYRDNTFRLNGKIIKKNPLDQARANAKWFAQFLQKSTGKTFPVQPVVLFPGWFIEREDTKRALADGVFLLNPKVLKTFVKNSSTKISNEGLHMAAYHTSMHIKNSKYN